MASLMDTRRIGWLARLILLVLMVYAFLAAIELFKNAIGMIGQGAADRLFGGLENPFAGLAVGILVTAFPS